MQCCTYHHCTTWHATFPTLHVSEQLTTTHGRALHGTTAHPAREGSTLSQSSVAGDCGSVKRVREDNSSCATPDSTL
eukprot:m.12098 g.12098  ORF g.12098 m.12098 type:complete len:77 (-) comp7657_c0_seq1:1718-1948(-)